jgi:hypothetical protein
MKSYCAYHNANSCGADTAAVLQAPALLRQACVERILTIRQQRNIE